MNTKKIFKLVITFLLLISMLAPNGIMAFANEEITVDDTQIIEDEQLPEPEPGPESKPIFVSTLTRKYPASNSFSLAIKQFRTISINVEPKNAENKAILWRSSNPSVATVNKNGKVVGVSKGTTVITANTTDGSNLSLSYTVTIKDRKTGTSVSMKKVTIVSADTAKYTYSQMSKDINALVKKYPELVSSSVIGKSYDNRNLYDIVVGNPNAKKKVVIQATIHGREYINSLLVMRQIETICANYYTGTYEGKYYSEIFDKTCYHIVPMTNPDGVTISQYGAKGIKDAKLRASLEKMCKKYGKGKKRYYTRWKSNARGVDLNKNYDVGWKRNKTGPKHPDQYGYKGSKAYSEKETQILMSLVNTVKPNAVISYHSTGSVIYWNFNKTGDLQKKSKSLFKVANKLTGYKDAEPNLSKTAKNGPNFGAWVTTKKKTPTLTIENGVGECPLPLDEYNGIWKKNKNLLPAIAVWASKN